MRKNVSFNFYLDKGEEIYFNMVTKKYVITNDVNIVVACGDFNVADGIEVKYEEIEDEKR